MDTTRRLAALALVAATGCAAAGAPGDPSELEEDHSTEFEDVGVEDVDELDAASEALGAPARQKEAYFSRPEPSAPDLELEKQLLRLLALAKPGSTVRGSVFTFTRPGMAKAFVRASKKARVELVLDGTNEEHACAQLPKAEGESCNAAFTILREAAKGETDDTDIRVTSCGSGCIGSNINHNKLFLFSALEDGSRDVVLQSSGNLTGNQTFKWNNTVVIRDDEGLYEGYVRYWKDLEAQRQDLDYNELALGSTGTSARFSPIAKGDPILTALSKVDCGTPENRTEIRVAMSLFSKARMGVARRLVELRNKEKCSVRVVLGQKPAPEIVEALEVGGVPTRIFKQTGTFTKKSGEEVKVSVSVHSKYLILKGGFAGKKNKKIVWTGSHNFTGNAVRVNDEALLKIDDGRIHDAFRDDWKALWRAAGR